MGEIRHIFLSYQSSDVDFALRLSADLKNVGVNLWMDRLDISPGDDWRKSVEAAVYSSIAIIAILSPEYVKSKHCQRELARADRLGRAIFPVLLGEISEHGWPLEVEREQYIDFSCWKDDAVLYQEKVNTLVDSLKEKFASQLSVIPSLEAQYLTNLVADLETRQGIAEYLETFTASDKLLEREIIRPEPHNMRIWLGQEMYKLQDLSLENTSDETVSKARLQRHVAVKDLYDVLIDHNHFVLTGAADSGKTTILRHLILDSVYAYQATTDAPIPFFVELVGWDDQTDFESFIRSMWPLESDPIELLKQRRLALYLDGLNELWGVKALKVKSLREWLAINSQSGTVIITCRDTEYGSDLDLPIINIEALDRDNIESFIANYLGEDIAPILLSQLLPQNKSDEDYKHYLYALARNPVLLSALIIVYKSSSFGYIPENVGALLRRLIHEIWERENQSDHLPQVVFEELETALADLAYTMIQEDMGVHIPVEHALEIIGDERQLFTAVRLNVINLKYGNVRFVYESYKNYFAAIALINHDFTTMLTKPLVNEGGVYQPGKWDQPIVILSGLIAEKRVDLLAIAKQNPFLALECLASGTNVSDRLIDPVIGQLIQVANTPDNDARVATAGILAKINYHMALPILLEAMREGAWEVRWSAMLAFKSLDLPTFPGLTEALEDLDHHIQDSTHTAIRFLGESTLPTLLKLLHHKKWKTRRGAAWALAYMRDQRAVPGLVHALYDEETLVSLEAAKALGYIQDVDAIPWLLEIMNHPNWRVRRAGAKALGDMATAAVPALLRALSHEVSHVRQLAIGALAAQYDSHVTAALLEVSYDESVDVRGAAINALAGRRDERAIGRLHECLNDISTTKWNRKRICDIAADILTTTNFSASMDNSEQAFQAEFSSQNVSENEETMNNAKGSAGKAKERLKKVTVTPMEPVTNLPLSEALNHVDWRVRLKAIENTAATDIAPVSVYLLIQAIDDEEIIVRMAALKAVPTSNVGACVNAWQKCLRDTNIDFVEASRAYILSLGKQATNGLIELLRVEDTVVKGQSIQLLGSLGDARAIAPLVDCLKDTQRIESLEQSVCDVAAKALRQLGTPQAQKAVEAWEARKDASENVVTPASKGERRLILTQILERLRRSNWGDKEDAAKALREYAVTMQGTHDDEIIGQLENALADPIWIVRWAAVEALAWIGDKASVPHLIRITDDPNWTVRIAVIRALLEIGESQAAQYILPLLKDENCTVREAAAEALGFLANPSTIEGLKGSLADEDPLVRLASVVALGKIENAAVIEPLVLALDDDDRHVRWATADAIRRINSEQIVPQLIGHLDDNGRPYWEDERVCDLVAEALTNIGTPDAKAAVKAWRNKQVATNG